MLIVRFAVRQMNTILKHEISSGAKRGYKNYGSNRN